MEDQIELAIKEIEQYWGEDTATKIVVSAGLEGKKMTTNDFLDHCVACGGNWGGMLLSGIKELFPNTYENIPEDMGRMAFPLICCVLMILGIEE